MDWRNWNAAFFAVGFSVAASTSFGQAPPPASPPALPPAVAVPQPGPVALAPISESANPIPFIMGPGGEGNAAATAEGTEQYGGDLWTRLRATGDWGGARTSLADRGLKFDFFLTQFYQGVAGGGREQAWEYGGKLDYIMNVDGQKLGLWQGFFIDLHAETRYGTDVNNIDGLLAPSNLPMMFPEPNANITSITGLKFTQALSENFVTFFGKINTLDEYGLRYSPGIDSNRPGLAGFLNTSLVFNPIVGRTMPYSAAGVGFAVLKEGKPFFALSAFDPQERATTGMQDLYARGVVIVPDLTFNVKPMGLPGKYNFGGTWSSASYRSFDPAAYLSIPPPLILDDRFTPKETGSWSLYSNFYQAIWKDDADDKRNWGIFGQFGISDGNPNPIAYVANGGIGGRSMIPGRDLDTFGLGYFYLGLSQNYKNLARPFLAQQDEYGVELFYNYAVTPWARLTGDLQIARPSTVGFNTAIIPGLRFQLVF